MTIFLKSLITDPPLAGTSQKLTEQEYPFGPFVLFLPFPPLLCSSWKNWDVVNGAVSEESEGGWNSGESSSGHQSNVFSDPNFNEVWSLPPDFSRSCENGSDGNGTSSDEAESDDGAKDTTAKGGPTTQ